MKDQKNGNGRERAKIDHWETDKIVFSESLDTPHASIGVTLDISHCVYEGGRTSFPRMAVTITRGDRNAIRLQCRDGDFSELKALKELLGHLTDNLQSEGAEELEKEVRAKRAAIAASKQRRIAEHNQELDRLAKEGGRDRRRAGRGLGQYSKPGKTQRKRARKKDQDYVE